MPSSRLTPDPPSAASARTPAGKRRHRAAEIAVLPSLLAAIALAVATASPAWAHAELVGASQAPVDSDVALTMNVPHERDDTTYNVDVQIALPNGFTGMGCTTKATWTCAVTSSGGRPVVQFTKAAGSAPAEDETFQFTVHTGTSADSYPLPTVQRYNTGEVVRWIDGAGTALPAPVLRTTGTAAPATTAAPPPPTAPITTAPAVTAAPATTVATPSTTAAAASTSSPPTTVTTSSATTATAPTTTAAASGAASPTVTAASAADDSDDGSDDGSSAAPVVIGALVVAAAAGAGVAWWRAKGRSAPPA